MFNIPVMILGMHQATRACDDVWATMSAENHEPEPAIMEKIEKVRWALICPGKEEANI